MGSELRQDYFGNFVLIASNRKFRPKRFSRLDKRVRGKCPFCPENEHLTPEETDRVEVDGKWIFRSFANKYSFATRGESHEVIIETRQHSKRLSDFKPKEMLELYHFYQRRVNKLRTKGYAYLFKNEGSYAGASIPHAHAQLITLPKKPRIIRVEKARLDFDDIRKKEKKLVISDDAFAFSYCPWASKHALEAWVACKRSGSTVGDLTVEEMVSISQKVLQIMKKLDKKLNNPSFNMLHHDSGPNYHVHVVPRITTLAGMEVGLRTYVNEVSPEEAVRFYRT